MSDTAVHKPKWYDVPYPELLLKPFIFLWRLIFKDKSIPVPSDRVVRFILIATAVLSVPVILLLEGVVNPLELLVDIPFFSFNDIRETDSVMSARALYLVFLPFFTMLFMKVLDAAVCRGREIRLFSVNGILRWITGLALGLLADAFTRNVFIYKVFIPLYDRLDGLRDTDMNAAWLFILLLLSMLIALYFALSDMVSGTVSIALTPYVLMALQKYGTAEVLQNTLLMYLIVTAALKLILMLAEKLGVLRAISDLVIKFGYTPRYMPATWIVLIAFWPVTLIVFTLKRSKNQGHDPRGGTQ